MSFPADPGVCAKCELHELHEGDLIVYDLDDKVAHDDCPVPHKLRRICHDCFQEVAVNGMCGCVRDTIRVLADCAVATVVIALLLFVPAWLAGLI